MAIVHDLPPMEDDSSQFSEVAEIFDDDNNEDDVGLDITGTCGNDLTLKERKKEIQKRSKARVIRSVWFNRESHPEKHHRELLMLFTAWRDESTDLLGDCESYME
ncbi:hypothetical protein ACROYT_G026256, partial [Oculina patagonica]